MAKITILGAGITGLSIAVVLSRALTNDDTATPPPTPHVGTSPSGTATTTPPHPAAPPSDTTTSTPPRTISRPTTDDDQQDESIDAHHDEPQPEPAPQVQQPPKGKQPHQITIIARDLPGDAPSQRWASPWACAGWVALGGATPLERQMQLDALSFLRRIAVEHPEAGVRLAVLEDVGCPLDHDGSEGQQGKGPTTWFAEGVEGFEVLADGGGGNDEVRVRYGSVVVTPGVFLGWLRGRLEKEAGVRVLRVHELRKLGERVVGDLGVLETEVMVNATGAGAGVLEDVRDGEVVTDRTYTVLVRSGFEGARVHRGDGVYTYFFGRGDGTAVLGGVSEPVGDETRLWREVYDELFPRAHAHFPEHFPSPDFADYDIVEDLMGIRPLRPAGVRVEKEDIDGLKVVHAYGTTIGGYIHSFGLAQEAARLVEESVAELEA